MGTWRYETPGEHDGHVGLDMALIHEAHVAGAPLRYVRLITADGTQLGVVHSGAPFGSPLRRLLGVLVWRLFPRCPWVPDTCIAGILARVPADAPWADGSAQLIFGDLPTTAARWEIFERAWDGVQERLGPDGPSAERLTALLPALRTPHA